MKISELKKIVEENGYEFILSQNGYDVLIKSRELNRLVLYTQDGNSIGLGEGYRIKDDSLIIIITALLDYIQTPISEREETKLYHIQINKYVMEFLRNSYIYIGFNHGSLASSVVTQLQIDNFPQEVKDAIKCGFLVKVEVSK